MRAGARAVFFTVATVVSVTPVMASDLPMKKPPPAPAPVPPLSDWHYDLTGYGWALNLTGDTGFGPLPTTPFFVSFDDLLRHLDYVLMARFVARNDTLSAGSTCSCPKSERRRRSVIHRAGFLASGPTCR